MDNSQGQRHNINDCSRRFFQALIKDFADNARLTWEFQVDNQVARLTWDGCGSGRALAGSWTSHGAWRPPRLRHLHCSLFIVVIIAKIIVVVVHDRHHQDDHNDEQVWLGWPVRVGPAQFLQQLAGNL